MDFMPDKDQGLTLDVPYNDEARSQDGWQGQGTSLSLQTLQSHVTQAMSRLGGVIHGFQRGSYLIGDVQRAGVQIHYSIEGPNGKMAYGRMDIAALPVKEPAQRHGWKQTLARRHDASLRMALYNVAQALRAQWVLKQLNPSYIPLMPWLLAGKNRTVSELYAESGYTKKLMPPKAEAFVEGEFRES